MVIDQQAHSLFDGLLKIAEESTPRNSSGEYCKNCGNELTVAYHEDRLYSVHCWRCRTVTMLTARDQRQAAESITAGSFPRPIPCRERLPDTDGYYLVRLGTPRGYCCEWEVIYYCSNRKQFGCCYPAHIFTHWLPLPDSPETEESADESKR